MKVHDLIKPETVISDIRGTSNAEVLSELADRASLHVHLDRLTVLRALLDRESLGSTGLGMGAAMPHAHFKSLRNPFALFVCLKPTIDFHALDKRPVDLIFLLLGPEPANTSYLKVLISTSRGLRDPGVRERLRASTDVQSIVDALRHGIEQNSDQNFSSREPR